jgi:hypothetical protein
MKKTLLCFLFLFTNFFYAQLSYVNICSGESFNLTSQNSVFIGSLDPATPVTYFLSLDDALNNTNEIPNSTNYYGPVGTNKIYGRLNNNGTYAINYFNLTVYGSITATASHLPISCKGGVSTLTVNAVPGATYYYSLNGGAFTTNKIFNNLPAGVYNIKVQSPNPICPDTVINYTITEPNAITAVSTTSGQSVTVTAAGGTAPYQYSKDGTTYQSSTVFNGLASGNYNFRIKDSRGCTYVMPAITIVVPGALAATAVIAKQLDCISGATIVANATGGQAPYTYSVNGGATYQTSNTFANILTGTFTIRVKDAANTISVSNAVLVTAPTAVNVNTAVTLPDCINNNATITVIATGGQAPYTYSKDNGATYNASNVFTNVLPGTYRIIVKDSKGCVSPFLNTTIQPYVPLAITASSTLISCNAGVSSLTINATGGRTPYQYSINNGTSYSSSNTYSSLSAGTYTIKVKDALGCISTLDHVINQPTALIATLSTSGQTVTVTASGGTAPYQYSLDGTSFQTSNVLTVLTSGNYLVQARDSQGCTRTFATAIVVPDPLTSSAVITKELDCISGASIAVNALGGQPPYLYSINGVSYQTVNTFTDISAGTYTIKVKDFANTISNSNTITVRTPSPVTATTLVTATDCTNKATIRVQAIGGKTPYMYSLDGGAYTFANTFYNVSPGTYTISVKDSGGCTAAAVATTIQPVVPLSVTALSSSILCNGGTGSLTISATGGQAPYEYSINNGVYSSSNTFTDLNAGTYTIKVRDAIGCSSEITHVITEPTALTATSVTFGQNIVITTNGGKAPYQYSLDGVNYQNSNVFLDTTSGTYPVTIKDSQGCSFTLMVKLEPSEQPLSSGVMAVKLIDCRGNGALRVIGYGGQPPYEYSINGGVTFQTSDTFNDLISGTYPVAVKDSQNTIVNNLSMGLNPFIPVTGSAIVTNSSACVNNGRIEISANGGQISYYYSIDGGTTYSANNTFSNLPAGTYTIFVKDSYDCISPAISATVEAASPLLITASNTSILCNGGTASLAINPIGGQGPYLYAINNDAYTFSNIYSSLIAGTYIIKVKDALGCSSELEYVITQPTALSAVINVESQTVTINGFGGTAPYQYSINHTDFLYDNVFTNLSPGQHPIFVKDANGCEAELSATVVAPLSFTTSTIKQADCSGNTQIIVAASGGQAPYAYSLSYTMSGTFYQSGNIFSKVPPGTYYLTVKDALNAVSSTNPIIISQPVAVTATATHTAILCSGETASLTITAISGEAPFQYSINNGAYTTSNTFTKLKAGTYTLNVKDVNSCTVSLSYTITEPTALTATANIEGQTVTINSQGGTAPYQYSADNVNFQSENVFTNLSPGLHDIFVKDANGCVFTLFNVTITAPTPLTSTAALTKQLNCGVKATITVTAAGGIAPYQYSIDGGITFQTSNVFTTLNAGTYNAVVKDAASTISNTTTIVINPLIPLVVDVTILKPLDCSSGAAVKATVTGGLTPYLYSIDNGSYSPTNTINIYAAGDHTITILDNAGCIVKKVITIAPYNPIVASTVITNVSCAGSNNGLIRVTTSGGIAPYTYSIGAGYQASNIFTNLAAGNYGISVKDKQGCIRTVTAVITQPQPLAASIVTTNATCYNSATGTITMYAYGGTSPYTYSIDNINYTTNKTFNSLSAGVYNVLVKDSKGCTMSYSTTISQPNPLAINLTKSDINCNGSHDGEITASATGGNAPYTYSINNITYSSSNTFSDLDPGQYNVTVKDISGCTTTSTITITQPAPLLLSAIVTNPTSSNYNDGRITVNATGGTAPYIYALKNNNGTTVIPPQNYSVFTNLTSGSYIAEVTDARGCTFFQPGINVIAPPPLVATISIIPLTCNTSGIITVTAMGGTAPYQYSFDNGATYTFSNHFSTVTSGDYVINVRDAQNNTTSLFAVIDPVSPIQLIATILSPVTCFQNGTITAIVNGGRSPYIYSLNGAPFQSSNTFNVPAGDHIIRVTDSYGCTAISAVSVTAPQPVIASVSIENQTATITTTGGSGNYRYAISPDLNLFSTSNTFTNLEAGDYTVIVMNESGCTITLNFEINPPAPLIEGKDAITVDFKPGQTLADLVVEGENIQWYSTPNPSESKTSKTNETPLPLTTVLVDGKTYYASQTINGIESKGRLAVTAKSNGTLSTSDFVLPNFKFYPNPVLHNLTISNTAEIDEVEIFSASGATVLSKKINSDQAEIDLSNVSTGVYLLKVKSEGQTKTIKIVKK